MKPKVKWLDRQGQVRYSDGEIRRGLLCRKFAVIDGERKPEPWNKLATLDDPPEAS